MVALFTRAWIEIIGECFAGRFPPVALFTRAWIEMRVASQKLLHTHCRPLHEGVD